jgi:Tfp pilus assembly protein PilW
VSPLPGAAARVDDESGVTLLELAITMMLLGIVLAMVVQVMIAVQSTVELEAGRSTRNDRLRLAVRALERQIRSGEVVGDPATENDAANGIVPGMSDRILTQSTLAGATERCSQWRIDSDRLEYREWSPNWLVDADVTGWVPTAEGISNRSVSPATPAFSLATEPLYGSHVIEIRLLGRGDSSESTVQSIETSVTGRNAVPGNPSTTCDNLPPY